MGAVAADVVNDGGNASGFAGAIRLVMLYVSPS